MNKINIWNIILAIIVCILLALLINGVASKRSPSSLPTLPKKEIDSIAAKVDVKPESITSVTKMTTNAHVSFKAKKDTVIIYRDRFNEITIDNSVTDTVEVTANIKDSLAIVTYNEKNWFAGQEKTFVKITNSNPYVHINNLERFEIKTKQKQFSLGIGIQYGFNGQKFQPQIGISLHKSLIKF